MFGKNRYLLIGLIIFIFFFSSKFLFKKLSLKINDSLNHFSYYLFKKISPQDIIVIGVDDYSLEKIPSRWPWRRSVYAELLNILEEEKVKAVFFDLTFVGTSEEAEDKIFSEAIKNFSGEILLAYFVDKEANPVYPLEDFFQNAKLGLINTPQDEDGLIRRARAYIRKEPFLGKSFSLEAARIYLDKEINISENTVEIGEISIPLDKHKTYNLNYLLKPKDLKYISFSDVLEKKFPKEEFKDKFVFVGSIAKIIHDFHLTPFGEFPGVYVHLNGFLNIVRNKFIRDLKVDLLIYILMLISVGIILNRVSFLRGVILSSGILLLLFWVDVILFSQGYRFNYGNILIFSFLYLSFGNLYRYFYSLFCLQRIKSKAVKDPLSGLFTQRYLYYLLDLELDKFYLKNLYLFCILIDGLRLNFTKLKETLREISDSLQRQDLKGALLTEESIVGFLYSKNINEVLLRWKSQIEDILSQRGINAKIKIGYLKAYRGLKVKSFFLDLFEKLKFYPGDITEYSQIVKTSAPGKILKDTLEFLEKDTEEKNVELIHLIERLKEKTENEQKAYFDLIASLITAIEERDPYTQGHSERVANYCLAVADKLNFSYEEKERLRKAALLHDLGKIGLPDEILHKKGRLTEEEFDFVKKHTSFGVKILEPISGLKDLIPYILHHHEHYDGSGYPHGLAGEAIPLGAQIISICDAFDALTTGRDYKKAFSIKEAVEELEKVKSKQFTPKLVDIFKGLIF